MSRIRSALTGVIAGLTGLTAAVATIDGAARAQAPAAPAPASAYYAGKTITIIVGLASGGTVDTFTRSLIPYLRKHIAGNPTIIAQNMPGAGGLLATNYINERATPDG